MLSNYSDLILLFYFFPFSYKGPGKCDGEKHSRVLNLGWQGYELLRTFESQGKGPIRIAKALFMSL